MHYYLPGVSDGYEGCVALFAVWNAIYLFNEDENDSQEILKYEDIKLCAFRMHRTDTNAIHYIQKQYDI